MAQEELIWSGRPSQAVNSKTFIPCGLSCVLAVVTGFRLSGRPPQLFNSKTFLLCFLFCFLIVPIFIAVWKWLVVRNTVIEITTQRLNIRAGVLNKSTAELELYRVKDFQIDEPLFLRMFGLSNILLVSTDRTQPNVVIPAVPNGLELSDAIREHVENLRRNLGIHEFA